MTKTSIMWEWLQAKQIATDDELRLVTDIIGYSVESLEKVLYARTGYRSMTQYETSEHDEE